MAHRRDRAGKKIDTLRWTASTVIANALTAGSAAVNVIAAGVPTETVMRTRGHVLTYVDGAQAPAGLVQVSMGLILVPEGTGTTVLWEPFGDSAAPWFWFSEVHVGYEEAVTDVIAMQNIMVIREVIDSKAMRRANVEEEVQFVVTNTTLNGARTVNVALSARFLLGS